MANGEKEKKDGPQVSSFSAGTQEARSLPSQSHTLKKPGVPAGRYHPLYLRPTVPPHRATQAAFKQKHPQDVMSGCLPPPPSPRLPSFSSSLGPTGIGADWEGREEMTGEQPAGSAQPGPQPHRLLTELYHPHRGHTTDTRVHTRTHRLSQGPPGAPGKQPRGWH